MLNRRFDLGQIAMANHVGTTLLVVFVTLCLHRCESGRRGGGMRSSGSFSLGGSGGNRAGNNDFTETLVVRADPDLQATMRRAGLLVKVPCLQELSSCCKKDRGEIRAAVKRRCWRG